MEPIVTRHQKISSVVGYFFSDLLTTRTNMIVHTKTVTKSHRIFFVRSTAHLENPNVLTNLVAADKPIVAPLLRTYATMRYAKKFRLDSSRWQKHIDETISFIRAAISTGAPEGIFEKFLAGTNFETLDPDSKFWQPLAHFYRMEKDIMQE